MKHYLRVYKTQIFFLVYIMGDNVPTNQTDQGKQVWSIKYLGIIIGGHSLGDIMHTHYSFINQVEKKHNNI